MVVTWCWYEGGCDDMVHGEDDGDYVNIIDGDYVNIINGDSNVVMFSLGIPLGVNGGVYNDDNFR